MPLSTLTSPAVAPRASAAARTVVERLPGPAGLRRDHPAPATTTALVASTRDAIRRILRGEDPRLLVVMGPCSLHDPVAAIEYAGHVAAWRERFGGTLLIVMRAYLEKPRTRLGWKGLLNDPLLDGSFRIGEGIRIARQLLLDLNGRGVPTATEFLDLTSAAYFEDLTAWSAIGARTTESPLHRQLASGLPFPVGFKNGTTGSVDAALNGMLAARAPHHLMAADGDGGLAVVATTGNGDGHLILRGGEVPNHDAAAVEAAAELLRLHHLPAHLMVDCGHANARGDLHRQRLVARDVAAQIAGGSRAIAGVMLESHLVEGHQAFAPGAPLRYGQSITDPCLGLEASEAVLAEWDAAVRRGRN